MRKNIIIFIVVFFLYLFLPSDSRAQQCINGGVECCVRNAAGFCGGDTFPGSCNNSCSADCGGASIEYDGCHWDNDGGGGGGGGGYVYPTCPSGKVLKAYSPMGKLNGGQCIQRIGCGDVFPSVFFQTGCDGKETKGECEISYLCCNPGDSITCTGSTVTRYGNCNAGEVKLSSDANGYFQCKRGCSCVAPCLVYAPTNLSFTTSTQTLTWTLPPSANRGDSQRIYYGTNRTDVGNTCPGGNVTACKEITGVGKNTSSKSFSGLLVDDRVYYFKVVSWKSNSCNAGSSRIVGVSSCNFTPNSLSMTVGDTQVITSGLDAITNTTNLDQISSVRFIKSGSSYSLSPANANGNTVRTTKPFTSTVSALSANFPSPATITSRVYLDDYGSGAFDT